MELIRGQVDLGPRHGRCVVTIGTYDGLHLGHQALIARVRSHAQRLAQPSVMPTFEPAPERDQSSSAANLTSGFLTFGWTKICGRWKNIASSAWRLRRKDFVTFWKCSIPMRPSSWAPMMCRGS